MHTIEVFMGGSPSPYGRSTVGKIAAYTKWVGSQANPRTKEDVMTKSAAATAGIQTSISIP